jgi:hypothetical protein
MPANMPSTKPILWDDLHISLYGPAYIRNDRAVRSCVRTLMKNFGEIVRKCMKDHAR